MSGEWRHGFCDCFGSLSDCCIGCWLPCCHAGMAANTAEQGMLMAILQCFCYPWLVPCMRSKARSKHDINGGCITDLVLGWCCPCCATIQIRREFK